MNEVLLQTIIEKLEALEIALLKQSDPTRDCESLNGLETLMKSLQSEIIKFSLECRTNTNCVNDLSNQINTLRSNYIDTERSEVRHIHHFHKPIWISLSLFVVSLLFAYGWMNCHNEKKQFEANDIQYRFWKANGNTTLLKIVYQTDSFIMLIRAVLKIRFSRQSIRLRSRRKCIGLRVKRKRKGDLNLEFERIDIIDRSQMYPLLQPLPSISSFNNNNLNY